MNNTNGLARRNNTRPPTRPGGLAMKANAQPLTRPERLRLIGAAVLFAALLGWLMYDARL